MINLATISCEDGLPPFILALDIGTSSVRAAFFDSQAHMIIGSICRQPVRITTQSDGTATLNADELLASICRIIDTALDFSRKNGLTIAGVACCTFVSNILAVDRKDKAITPVYTYLDTRPKSAIRQLNLIFDEDIIHQRTGCHFHTSYLTARFVWLKQTQPEWINQDLRWMSISEYLALNFFGEALVSYSVASWTGLLNRQNLEWDDELLSALHLKRDKLSPLVDIDHPWKKLKPQFVKRWPELNNCIWFPAVGDGAAANIGSNCISADRVALTMGTSTAVRVILDKVPSVPKGLWCYRVDRDLSLLGGALSEGGNLYSWFQSTLLVDDLTDLDEALSAIPPDSHGLTILPFIAGERSPGWAGEAKGVITGFTLATNPTEIIKAGYEAVAYRIAIIYQYLKPLVKRNPTIIVSGGALQSSPAWTQIISDVLATPVFISSVPETSARGIAMLALRSLGVVKKLSDFKEHHTRAFHPDQSRHLIYQKAIERQKLLYRKLIRKDI